MDYDHQITQGDLGGKGGGTCSDIGLRTNKHLCDEVALNGRTGQNKSKNNALNEVALSKSLENTWRKKIFFPTANRGPTSGAVVIRLHQMLDLAWTSKKPLRISRGDASFNGRND